MAGPFRAYPMYEVDPNCGNAARMHVRHSHANANLYCKPDQAMVGEADTMVISVNIW